MLERGTKDAPRLDTGCGHDTRKFVEMLRAGGVPLPVAQHHGRHRSAVGGGNTRLASDRQSQRRRKLVEEVFGWLKTAGGECRRDWM